MRCWPGCAAAPVGARGRGAVTAPRAGCATNPGHELLPGLAGCGHELVSGDRDGQVPLSCRAMLGQALCGE